MEKLVYPFVDTPGCVGNVCILLVRQVRCFPSVRPSAGPSRIRWGPTVDLVADDLFQVHSLSFGDVRWIVWRGSGPIDYSSRAPVSDPSFVYLIADSCSGVPVSALKGPLVEVKCPLRPTEVSPIYSGVDVAHSVQALSSPSGHEWDRLDQTKGQTVDG